MTHTEESVTFDLFTPLIEETFTPLPAQNENLSLSVTTPIRFLVGVMIILLNAAVIYCTNKWTRLKRTTRTLFLNLAASDILFAVSTMLATPLMFPQANWMRGQICRITFTFTTISRCACSTGIMLLAFDIFAITVVFSTSNITPSVSKPYFIGTVLVLSWLPVTILFSTVCILKELEVAAENGSYEEE